MILGFCGFVMGLQNFRISEAITKLKNLLNIERKTHYLFEKVKFYTHSENNLNIRMCIKYRYILLLSITFHNALNFIQLKSIDNLHLFFEQLNLIGQNF